MNKISEISKIKEVQAKQNDDVVKILEGILKDAKEGEIIGFAMAAQYKNYYFSTSWVLADLKLPIMHLVGVLERLKLELLRKYDD